MSRKPSLDRRRLARRAFLGGSAVVIGLPFFESLAPRAARAQQLLAPRRLIYYYVPNGMHMPGFRPAQAGAGYTMPSMLVSLEDLRSDLSIVTGLNNENGNPTGPGDHASGTSAFITCAKANKSESEIHLGVSADQIAAQQIGTETRVPSLQLGIEGGSSAGGCDSGYSCAYSNNISWAGPTTPLTKLTDPGQVFDELFRGYDAQASQAEIEKRRAYDKSVLDLVKEDANSLKLKLGKSDGLKLEQYLTGIFELERRLLSDNAGAQCMPGLRPSGDFDFQERMKAMLDLMVLALQCDATRIISFMQGNAVSGRTYPFLGIDRGHHDISHHGSTAQNLADLEKIGTWELEQFGYLLRQLKAATDGPSGESNLLYNTAIYFSSDISDGDEHNHDDMPIIVAGHGGGELNPGRHIVYDLEQKERVANLLVRMLQTVGVNAPLGDSTAPLADL
jgi:hypothetical protein